MPSTVWEIGQSVHLSLPNASDQRLTIESADGLRSRDEQTFYDWSVGILEDAGVVGVLKNDYVYQASTFHGDIDTGAGKYSVMLSRADVEFGLRESRAAPIEFTGAIVDTAADVLEASQVGNAFLSVRRQSALVRAWKDATSMASTSEVLFNDLRVLSNQVAMDLETEFLDFTVTVRRSTLGIFEYALTGNQPIVNSVRVADAVLCDVAEGAGGIPNPSTLISAMILVADKVQRDPEWLAAKYPRRARHP